MVDEVRYVIGNANASQAHRYSHIVVFTHWLKSWSDIHSYVRSYISSIRNLAVMAPISQIYTIPYAAVSRAYFMEWDEDG